MVFCKRHKKWEEIIIAATTTIIGKRTKTTTNINATLTITTLTSNHYHNDTRKYQVYFLNNPNVDFAVGGLANVTDLPGISSILRLQNT